MKHFKLSAFGLLPHHRKRPYRSKKMGYFTTIVNNYQHLINFFPEPNMVLAMNKPHPKPIWATARYGLIVV
jgi:hypothetical protein